MESVTASIAWLESGRDKRVKGRMKGVVEETEGMRKERFEDEGIYGQTRDKSAHVRVLINEKEIKTESLLYSIS